MKPAAFSGFSDPGNARVVCRTGQQEPDVALSGLVTRSYLQSTLGEPSSETADADFSVSVAARYFRHTGTLTDHREVALDTTGAVAGDSVLITRSGGGAFNLNVGTGPLKALGAGTWGLFVFDGNDAYLAACGAL